MERLRLGAAFQAVGDVLGERRAVLEAVPRATAEQPPRLVLGMAVEDEVRVRRQVVLADAAADHRGLREPREAVRGVVAGDLLELARRQPVERVRIDGLTGQVGRDLRAETGDLAMAVERRVVLAEARRATPRRVGTEEEDVAARDLQLDQPGKNCGSQEPQAQTTTSAAG